MVSADLQERIVDQVEWYFSDENLLKDSFLMKHIHRNKQGLVSLKLVASFRKVKSLTKDWRVVQASLLQSSQLELNVDRSKVRRVAAVPRVDYSHAARTIIISNHPSPQPAVQDIESAFSKYGEVTLVRVIHPGKAVPLDVKPSRAQHPAIGKSLCILVEFESQEGAERACKKFNSQQSWRDQLSVALLSRGGVEAVEGGKLKEGRKPVEGEPHFLSPAKFPGHRNVREPSPARPARELVVSKKRHRGSPAVSRKFLSPDNGRDKEYSSDSGCSTGRSRSPRLTPEPLRKFPSDQSILTRRNPGRVQEARLIRQPAGPDGTRGFLRPTLPIQVSVSS